MSMLLLCLVAKLFFGLSFFVEFIKVPVGFLLYIILKRECVVSDSWIRDIFFIPEYA